MVKFGKKLLENRHEPWAPYYLDYQGLKGCLELLKRKQKLLQQQQYPSSKSIISSKNEIPPPPPSAEDLMDGSLTDQFGQSPPQWNTPKSLVGTKSPLITGGLPASLAVGSPPPHRFSAGSPQISRGSLSEYSSHQQSSPYHETREFETFLEDEVEKIGLFFLQIQGEVAAHILQVRQQQLELFYEWETQAQQAQTQAQAQNIASTTESAGLAMESSNSAQPPPAADNSKLQTLYTEYHTVAVQLLHLVGFVESNVTGIRKILKKHDKITKKHLTYQYISFHGNQKELKHLWTSLLLHQYEGITALNSTLKVALTELRTMDHAHQVEQELQLLSLSFHNHNNDDAVIPNKPAGGKPPLQPNNNSNKARHHPAMSMPNIVLSQEDIAAAAGGQRSSMTPQAFSKKQPYGTMTNNHNHNNTHTWETIPARRELDAIMLKIEGARRRLHISSNTFQDMLAAQIVMLEPQDEPSDQDEADMMMDEDEEDKAIAEKWLSHFLNLTSTFLYMTNYYVVAPTSGHYAKMLGGDEALAGIIIGMTPIAALVSTILYSWWTSHSYKAALVFASSCSIAGNIFYALGLPCNNLTFVMVGRLLNGFGSARSINRRYIADTFPPRQRTAESANFVTAGALGMAAGPAIATLLHIGFSDTSDERIGNLHQHTEETFIDADGNVTQIMNDDDMVLQPTTNTWWTPENAPGWFMFGMWTVYLVLLCLYFEDPPRHKKETQMTNSKENEVTEPTAGEKEALLAAKDENEEDTKLESFDDSDYDDTTKEIPIWRNIPVMTTFVIYFVLKLVLECLLSSTATLTGYYFHWDSSITGIYLAILGLLMLPANLGIAILARNHDDRELIFGCEVAMLLGCFGIIQYTSPERYSAIQYVFFSIIIFLSTNALEGPNMSLLSKTIPKSWSRGLFNVGLLATEAGTLGRAVGDVLLSAWGFKGLGSVLNDAFRTMSILSALSVGLTMYFFEQMEPHEKDD